MASDKGQAVALLRMQERVARAEVKSLRDQLDGPAPLRPTAALIIAAEAKATAYAHAVEIVDGVPF
jgi:hypothetical protein